MKPAFALLFAGAVLALPAAAQVKITPGEGKIPVEINGKPFTDFYVAGKAFDAEITKPYLWPLRAATGTYITRAWPMEMVAEEAAEKKDHQHQRGLWFAHDNVNKLDFWNNEASYKTPNRGKMTLKKTAAVTSGKDKGSITATFEWTGMDGANALLTEQRLMTFYADPKLRYFDVDLTLIALQTVTFGDGKDGAFGIRLRPVLQEDKKENPGRITNAEGLAGMKQL